MKMEPRREIGTLIFHYSGVCLGLLLIALAIINIIINNNQLVMAITSGLVGILVVVVVGYGVLKVEYRIDEEDGRMFVQSGFFKDNFKFNEVKELENVKTFFPKGTIAKEKICIRYKKNGTKDPTVYEVFIATKDDRAAMEYLRNKCHAAKYISKDLQQIRKGKKKK